MTAPLTWFGSCFYGNQPDSQRLAIVGSGDGDDWWWLNNTPNPQPVYTPPDGALLRDPTFYWSNASGTWTCYIAYTHLSTLMVGSPGVAIFLQGKNFGIAKSTTPWDPTTWTHVADIDCSAAVAATPTIPSYSYWPAPAWGDFSVVGHSSGTLFGHLDVTTAGGLPFSIPASTAITLTLSGQVVTTQAAVTPAGSTVITLSTTYTAAGNTGTDATCPGPIVYTLGGQVTFSGNTYTCTLNGGTGANPTVDTAHWQPRRACWGPNWFLDPTSGNLYVAMQMNIQDIYLFQCLDTVNFNSFDTGTLVVQHSTVGFPSTNYACFILKLGNTYHMWSNTQTSTDPLAVAGAGVWHATSANLLLGWTYQNLDYGGVFEGTYVVNDGTQWIAFGDNPTHIARMTTASLTPPITWSAPTPLTLAGGLAQSDPTSAAVSPPNGPFAFMREGAFAPIGIPASPSYNPNALAVVQAASIYPPKVGVGASM